MKRLIPVLFVLAFVGCEEEKVMNKVAIEQLITEFESCKSTHPDDRTACKHFTAEAICKYNAIDDLKDEEGHYIDYHEIYDFVNGNSGWTFLGNGNDQSVLDNAQDLANKGYAVIAIDSDDKHKFCALIVEGEQKKSGSWGLNAPNSAAFFPGSKPESFVNKTLNYAFRNPETLEIFVNK